ncbi:MAG: hypothetical protein JST32_03360 [Bacteroidetes bacterium]|nr:hypothetical protein [Bacteroidota bacterium]
MEFNKVKAKRLKLKGSLFAMVLLLLSATATPSKAQSFSDLFGQGGKELQNMARQIAALNAFETSVRQGYTMLKGEWTAIGNWKNGEFSLHQSYYTSLGNVTPAVKSDPDVATMQSEQQMIVTLLTALQRLPRLQPDEQAYVQSVAANLLKACDADMQQLQNVLKPGALTMSDDERLKEIGKLQSDMLDKYRFTQNFCNSVRLMVVQRNRENNEVQTLNQLYETD